MSNSSHWILDPNGGAKAVVEGVEARDRWTKVLGWAETTEPGPGDRVWLYHAGIAGRTVLSFEASQGHWKGVGWVFGAPPEPVDTTKDPALMDQATPLPVSVSATTTAAAVGADKSKGDVTRG